MAKIFSELCFAAALFSLSLSPAWGKELDEKSFYSPSDDIASLNQSMTKGSETMTLLGEKTENLTPHMTIHARELIYINQKNHADDSNFHRLIIKKGNDIIYRRGGPGEHPSYYVVRMDKENKALVIRGGYSHSHEIEVFAIKNDSLKKIQEYSADASEMEDVDHDGIPEISLVDVMYSIPGGALCNSAGIWIVLRYDGEKYSYSPAMIREKNKDKLSVGEKKCNLTQESMVRSCTDVVENLILNCHINNFDAARRTISHNMEFDRTEEKKEFLRDFSSWFFRSQFINEFSKHTGLRTADELEKVLQP